MQTDLTLNPSPSAHLLCDLGCVTYLNLSFPICKWEVAAHFPVSVRLNPDQVLTAESGTEELILKGSHHSLLESQHCCPLLASFLISLISECSFWFIKHLFWHLLISSRPAPAKRWPWIGVRAWAGGCRCK